MNIIPTTSPDDEAMHWRCRYEVSCSERPFDWFGFPADLTRRINSESFPEGGTGWGLAAVAKEATKIRETKEGSRNSVLWSSGCRIGQLVGGGELFVGHAVSELTRAGLDSGLTEEETLQVLVRPSGAIETGIWRPRDRSGFLDKQFAARTLRPSTFKVSLFTLDDCEWWLDALDGSDPGLPATRVRWAIEELGVIYWSNYCYFLQKIHSLVIRGARGTKLVYDLLMSEYLSQAEEAEILLVDLKIGLRTVLANTPTPELGLTEPVFDVRSLVEEKP